MNLYIKNAKHIQRHINKEFMHRHVRVKLQNTKDKEKIIKATAEDRSLSKE